MRHNLTTLLLTTLLITALLLSATASALPIGYKFNQLGCGNLAGISVPSLSVKTHIAATGDFLSRSTNVKYSTADLQATDIGYTSHDSTNGRYVLEYDLDQYYTDGTPSINADHYLETSGSSISKEEAGLAYTAISENASNADTPTSVKFASGYTTMTTNGGTYDAQTSITASLASDQQPQTLSMNGKTSGLNGETFADGATFWDWSASYNHRLAGSESTAVPAAVTGNESMSTHEFGMTGGDHATTYAFKANVASKVSAILFEQPPENPADTIAPISESETTPVGISQPDLSSYASDPENPTSTVELNTTETNTTVNTTTNLTANLTEELPVYNMANYNTQNLNLPNT